MNGIRIAIISPVNYLEEFSTRGDIHMMISAVCSKSKKYREFYKKEVQKGKFVIQDNSVFEEGKSLTSHQLISIAIEMRPSIIVTPEVLGSRKDTVNLTKLFLKTARKNDQLQKNHSQYMAVVQGKTEEDWFRCFEELLALKDLSQIGIPFDMSFRDFSDSKTNNWMMNRVYMVSQLHLRGLVKRDPVKLHLMGASNLLELTLQRTLNLSHFSGMSMDSSSPVVHGMNGIPITSSGLPGEKIDKKLNFTGKIDRAWFTQIHFNIDQMLKLGSY